MNRYDTATTEDLNMMLAEYKMTLKGMSKFFTPEAIATLKTEIAEIKAALKNR